MLAALLLAAIPSQAGKKAKHLLFIGIDGFSSEGLRTVNPADVPNLKFLMENGSYTLAKRSVMPSASAINWATIFMGIPTEMHCYYRWNSASPDIPAAVPMSEHGMPATIYTLVRQQKPSMKTACFYNWDGIGKVTDTLAMTSHLDYFATYGRKDYSLERYAREFGAEYILKEKPIQNLHTITFYHVEIIHPHERKVMAGQVTKGGIAFHVCDKSIFHLSRHHHSIHPEPSCEVCDEEWVVVFHHKTDEQSLIFSCQLR